MNNSEIVTLKKEKKVSFLAQLGLMMQWQLRRMTESLPLLIVLQIMLALATVGGYGLLVGDTDRVSE